LSIYLARFARSICAASAFDIRSDVTLGGKLIIEQVGNLEVSYAPFEHIEREARIVIVGITPGKLQATNALCEIRRQLLDGADQNSALAAAKVHASFSGGMRANLVKMLDYIGVARSLGIPSADALWTTHGTLAHFTSALRYPVFFSGKNFNGQVDMTRSRPLVRLLDQCLAEEAATLPDAVWVPAGPTAGIGVQYLVGKGLVRSERVLAGLPHPSMANNERVQYFIGQKARGKLSAKTNPAIIDVARESLIAKVAALPTSPEVARAVSLQQLRPRDRGTHGRP